MLKKIFVIVFTVFVLHGIYAQNQSGELPWSEVAPPAETPPVTNGTETGQSENGENSENETTDNQQENMNTENNAEDTANPENSGGSHTDISQQQPAGTEKTQQEKNVTGQQNTDGSEPKTEQPPVGQAASYALSLGITLGTDKAVKEAILKNKPKETDKAQSANIVHKFAGGVSEIVNAGMQPVFFAAGNDGFVTRYSYPDFKPDTWQLSFMPIKKIAVHPQGRLVAIYESDGFGVHQVSLWDWTLKKNIFAKRLSDSVASLSWSAKGTYLFIGNRSTDGITVLDSKGNVKNIYSQAPGIVFLAATASSEKNIVTYGESGRLIYTEIASKKKIKEFRTENKLENPNLIKNFNLIIGYKNKTVYVIDAVTGKVKEQYPANYAIFAAKLQDSAPIWIERTRKKNEWCIRQGKAASQGFYVPSNSKITAARHVKDNLIIGTEDGSVYMLGMNVDSTVKVETPLEYERTEIDDITTDGESVYVLQEGKIYSQKSPDEKPVLITAGLKTNRFLFYNNGFLLWSNERKHIPIYHYSFETGKLKTAAQPKESVISLSVYKDNILYVESFNGVSLINSATGKKTFFYNAPGVQNAVQIDDENILISKSAIDRAQSPVFLININTEETAPIQIEGDLIFALEQNSSNPNTLSCFLVNSKPSNKTELITIKLSGKNLIDSSFKPVLSYKEEDLTAFLKTSGNDILTNLGKGSLVHYNTATRQAIRLKRDYGFSKDAVILKNYFVSLNMGGTISWYSRKEKVLLKTNGIDIHN